MAISADARPFRPCLLSPEPSTSAHNALCDLVPVLSCLSWECCALFRLPRPSVAPHPGPCGWTLFPRGQGTMRSHPSLSLKPQSQTPPGLLQEMVTHFWGGTAPRGGCPLFPHCVPGSSASVLWPFWGSNCQGSLGLRGSHSSRARTPGSCP